MTELERKCLKQNATELRRVAKVMSQLKEARDYVFSRPRQRKEVLESIKYVSKVIKSGFFITDNFLKKNRLDKLVHGSDNSNKIPKNKLLIFPRTLNISSTDIRKTSYKNIKKLLKKI